MDQVAVTSALGAVVALHSRIPETALTASLLGTERGGHGVGHLDEVDAAEERRPRSRRRGAPEEHEDRDQRGRAAHWNFTS